MKRLFLSALLTLISSQAFAGSIFFQSGFIYKAPYQDGVGTATLVMTGSPEYVVISTDSNHCGPTHCYAAAIKSDLYSMPLRLVKSSETETSVTYKAEVLPLTEAGEKRLGSWGKEAREEMDVTVTAELSRENNMGGTPTSQTPRIITMKVNGRTYTLHFTSRL